jgi:hypothetical protein
VRRREEGRIQVHKDFEEAMRAAGAKCNMPYHPGCTQK